MPCKSPSCFDGNPETQARMGGQTCLGGSGLLGVFGEHEVCDGKAEEQSRENILQARATEPSEQMVKTKAETRRASK